MSDKASESANEWWLSKCNGSYFIARAAVENTTQEIARDAFIAGYEKGQAAGREWIPVSESMPEDGELVTVYVNNLEANNTAFRNVDWVVRGEWRTYARRVTHWQPLPPAPKALARDGEP